MYIGVHDFEASRACKERSDGIAIATRASIAFKISRDLARSYLIIEGFQCGSASNPIIFTAVAATSESPNEPSAISQS